MIDIHETAGPYAVDALDPAEVDEYERHLAGCTLCRAEIAEFCETAAELSQLALATPGPALRGRILDAVRTTPQLPGADAAPAQEAEREPDAPGDELALRRRRRRSRLLTGLVAAMVALAVGLGGIVYAVVQDRQAQVAQVDLEQQLTAAPDAVTTTTALVGGGRATFVASRQLDRAMFVGTELPDQGSNRLQLWTVVGTDLAKPTGVARDAQATVTGPVVKLFFRGDIAGSDFLAVNLEPAGSTPTVPTTAVLAAAPTAG